MEIDVITSIKQAQKLVIYKNASIKNVTKQVFNLQDPDYMVLETIARLGYLNKNQINDNLATSTLRQVRWRIDKILFPGEFLFVKEKKPYHNIKKAFKTKDRKGYKLTEKKYGLTFKGFLASFFRNPLKENYLIKEYRPWLTSKIENDVLEYIQIHLKLYFLTLKYQGIKLDDVIAPYVHIKNIDFDFPSKYFLKKDLKDFDSLRKDFDKLRLKIHKKIPNSKEGNDLTVIILDWFNVIQAIIDDPSRSSNRRLGYYINVINKKLTREQSLSSHF